MKKNTLLLLGVIVILIVAAWLVLQQPGEQSSSLGSGSFMELDSAAIDKLEIKNQFGEFTLEKQGGEWKVKKPINYKASEQRLSTGLGMLANMREMGTVSTNPAKQGVYQVDSTGSLIKVYQKGEHVSSLIVGKTAPTNQRNMNQQGPPNLQSYVREEGSDDVILVSGGLTFVFNAPLKDWRDKAIYIAPPQGITSVTYQSSEESFTLSLADSSWQIDGVDANQDEAKALVFGLNRMETDFFHDEKMEAEPEITNMIIIGDTQIVFSKIDEERYYVRSSTSPQWYIMLKWKTTKYLKTKKDLMPKDGV